MMVAYHPAARAELEAEVGYYNNERPGAGSNLRADVKETISPLRQFPLLGRPDGDGIRRIVTQRYRFIIHYVIVGNRIVILAVAHPSREPGYWLQRLL
ncbi:MAG: type II toxin-antitoxin system RelE/ParE family toxin [Verrucomicrobiota bacterium]